MQHNFLRHEGCKIQGCNICSGTVKICLNCGGISTGNDRENSLTTHCVSEQLSADMKTKISRGEIDYIGGRWINKKLGPTIREKLKEFGSTIAIGTELKGLKDKKYICIGTYFNSKKETVYCLHEIVNDSNKHDAEFIALIHWSKLEEIIENLPCKSPTV